MDYLMGFLIAAAVGMTGVGSGSITAPMLILFFHLTPTSSVGTALSFAAVIKLAVMPIYIRRKQIEYRILMLLCSGGVPGVLFGVYVIGRLDTRNYEHVVFLVLGLTILIVSLSSVYRSIRKSLITAPADRSLWLPPVAALIGSEVGFSSAGAGALGSLAILSLTRITPAKVVGTDMLFGLVLSLLGGGLHFMSGHYDSAILPRLIIGGIPGAFTGATLSSILPGRPLRLAMSVWLALLGFQLCWKAFS